MYICCTVGNVHSFSYSSEMCTAWLCFLWKNCDKIMDRYCLWKDQYWEKTVEVYVTLVFWCLWRGISFLQSVCLHSWKLWTIASEQWNLIFPQNTTTTFTSVCQFVIIHDIFSNSIFSSWEKYKDFVECYNLPSLMNIIMIMFCD